MTFTKIIEKKNDLLHTTWKTVLITAGTLLTLDAVFLFFVSNMNLGLVATLCLGMALLMYGVLLDGLVKKIPRCIKGIFWSGVVTVISFVSFFLIYGASENPTYEEDVIIVLGCGIHGERITESLRYRLDRAIEYSNMNPDAMIVVSGGKGPQEDITEALAMERYLLSQGIPQEKIIKEEQSTSTFENFTYTKEILDERYEESYKIVYVTNDYHTFRAGQIARKVGFEDVTYCSAQTAWYSKISCCLRECIGVLKYWVLGN